MTNTIDGSSVGAVETALGILEHERDRLTEVINRLRGVAPETSESNSTIPALAVQPAPAPKTSGDKIAEAQRKRWAKFRLNKKRAVAAAKKAATEPPAPEPTAAVASAGAE